MEESTQGKLNMFLAVIVTLFMIGLIIFIFIISNNKILGAMLTTGTGSGNLVNETLLLTNGSGTPTSVVSLSGVILNSNIVLGTKTLYNSSLFPYPLDNYTSSSTVTYNSTQTTPNGTYYEDMSPNYAYYYNYTLPDNTIAAYWNVNDNRFAYPEYYFGSYPNGIIPIPFDCLNGSILRLRVISNYDDYLFYSCYNYTVGSFPGGEGGYIESYNLERFDFDGVYYGSNVTWTIQSTTYTNYLSCYQEFANQTSSCGGLGTGVYNRDGNYVYANEFDGDWSTYAYCVNMGNAGTPCISYANYTKSLNAVGAINEIKYQDVGGSGVTVSNLTIPNECFNPTVQLSYTLYQYDGDFAGLINVSCVNSTGDWNVFSTLPSWVAAFYEEAIYWLYDNQTYYSTNSSYNITVVLSPNNYTTNAGYLIGNSSSEYLGSNIKLSSAYTYNTEVTDSNLEHTASNTNESFNSATDFFPTIIVLASMVVLVILTVLIINSIRNSGITREGA